MNIHRRLIVTKIDDLELLDVEVTQDIRCVATATLLDGEHIKLALTFPAYEALLKALADRPAQPKMLLNKSPRKAA